MQVHRSDSGDLHREGLPCIIMNDGTEQHCWMNKLHNSRGPAVTTPNGTRHYYWRGVHVDQKLWNEMPNMKARDIISMTNLELRRVVIERVGFDKLKKEARPIDTQKVEGGKNILYVLEMKDDENAVFAELVNSTPEPDGSRKIYYLRVPPDTKTVREAVAWSFSLEEEFSFLVET